MSGTWNLETATLFCWQNQHHEYSWTICRVCFFGGACEIVKSNRRFCTSLATLYCRTQERCQVTRFLIGDQMQIFLPEQTLATWYFEQIMITNDSNSMDFNGQLMEYQSHLNQTSFNPESLKNTLKISPFCQSNELGFLRRSRGCDRWHLKVHSTPLWWCGCWDILQQWPLSAWGEWWQVYWWFKKSLQPHCKLIWKLKGLRFLRWNSFYLWV